MLTRVHHKSQVQVRQLKLLLSQFFVFARLKTDAGREVKFDEKEKPGISNLLTIHSSLSGRSIADLENEFEGKGYGDFKGAVAEVVVEYLRPIRAKALELLEDEKHLIDLLHNGAEKARIVASQTLSDTYKNLGLVK